MISTLFSAALAFQAASRGAHHASHSRVSSSISASALAEMPVLQGQPPSAPPPTAGGGGGGGDGDGGGEFLRLLNAAEQTEVIADWAQRSRIYKLTDNAKLAEAHGTLVTDLEALESFDTAESGPDGRRMLLGLFDEEQLWALASAEVSRSTGLVVSNLCVYPAELNNEDSTAALRLVHALHLLADAIETPIELKEGCHAAMGDLLAEGRPGDYLD